LWTGLEEHRIHALCKFCDTDFVGTDGANGGSFSTAHDLASLVGRIWLTSALISFGSRPLVVCTGGEPLLQLNDELVRELHAAGFELAVETNGTQALPSGVDFVCVSPKAGTDLQLRAGDELKLVFPQEGAAPEEYQHLSFKHFFLQPMDGPSIVQNTQHAIKYCLEHPQWRLSLQIHKLLGLP
jgi:7-carboxy-7-deazaguanine synthase (Cx14CxxC type)